MRSGHGSIKTASSVWSTATSWDAFTGCTTAFIEGLFDDDLADLQTHIRSSSQFLGHPLMLPEILLHMVTFRLNERMRIPCEEEFYQYEQRTGLSNLPYFSNISHAAVWQWNVQDFQQATTMSNRSLTTMVRSFYPYLSRPVRLHHTYFLPRLSRRFSDAGSNLPHSTERSSSPC